MDNEVLTVVLHENVSAGDVVRLINEILKSPLVATLKTSSQVNEFLLSGEKRPMV